MVLWQFSQRGKANSYCHYGISGALHVGRPSGGGAMIWGTGQGSWSDLFGEANRAALPVSVPLPKSRPADAPTAESEKPVAGQQKSNKTDKNLAEQASVEPSACRLALTDQIAIAQSIPDIHGPGECGSEDLVRLEAVVLPDKHQVVLKPPAILHCTMASAIADWIRTDMVPFAASLGSVIRDLENFKSFECRGRNRVVGAKLSEHGRANALDVRALILANDQSIPLTDRTVARETRENLRHSVCTRFSTVLGRARMGYHEDHIHLDLMERHKNYKICQWSVWDPLPQIAPLMPIEWPKEALPNPTPRTVQSRQSQMRPNRYLSSRMARMLHSQ